MKKILIILIVIAGIGGGIAFSLGIERKETLRSDSLLPEGTAEVTALLTKDTDGDSLKDWEEELWGTDLSLPDTDKDGTPDGEEIVNRRDPLKAGPDDPLDEASVREKTTLQSTSTPLTDTDRLAREFFTTYLEIKREGGTLSTESLQLLGERMFENAPVLTAPVYAESDLILSHSKVQGVIRTYGNTVGATIGAAPAFPESELDILSKAAKGEDREYIERLDPIIAAYAKLFDDLRQIPVPDGAQDEHLALLSSVSGIKVSIENMRKLFENPIVVLPAVALHKESADNLILALRALDHYFLGKGISFKETESGYLITRLSI